MQSKRETARKLMREMMGEPFQVALEQQADSGLFGSQLFSMTIEHCFADVWARPGLERKYRSMITMAILIALRQTAELKNHVRFSVTNGCTVQEIEELLIQAMPYVGLPAVAAALSATTEALRECGLGDMAQTAEEKGVL